MCGAGEGNRTLDSGLGSHGFAIKLRPHIELSGQECPKVRKTCTLPPSPIYNERMADGRWVMTNEELNTVVCTMNERTADKLPNFRQHRQVDNRGELAERLCAFCGGITDFVYKDDVGKYFK